MHACGSSGGEPSLSMVAQGWLHVTSCLVPSAQRIGPFQQTTMNELELSRKSGSPNSTFKFLSLREDIDIDMGRQLLLLFPVN